MSGHRMTNRPSWSTVTASRSGSTCRPAAAGAGAAGARRAGGDWSSATGPVPASPVGHAHWHGWAPWQSVHEAGSCSAGSGAAESGAIAGSAGAGANPVAAAAVGADIALLNTAGGGPAAGCATIVRRPYRRANARGRQDFLCKPPFGCCAHVDSRTQNRWKYGRVRRQYVILKYYRTFRKHVLLVLL